MDLEIIRQRVDNGIEFLNEELGTTWPWELDARRLDLQDMMYCVIGQLYGEELGVWGGWQTFKEKHDPSLEWLTAHGFDDVDSGNYIYLTMVWVQRIREITNT